MLLGGVGDGGVGDGGGGEEPVEVVVGEDRGGDLGAVAGPELATNGTDVVVRGDGQLVRDLGVGEAATQQPGYLDLAGGQAGAGDEGPEEVSGAR